MERHDGVVGARLHRDVAARQERIQVVVGERGDVGQRGGAEAGQPEPVLAVPLEQRRPEADRHRQPRRGEAGRLARVLGRRGRRPFDGADRPALRHVRDRRRPRAHQFAHVGGVLGRDVERGEEQPVLDRGGDAGLVRAVERDAGGKRGAGVALARLADGDAAGHGAGQPAVPAAPRKARRLTRGPRPVGGSSSVMRAIPSAPPAPAARRPGVAAATARTPASERGTATYTSASATVGSGWSPSIPVRSAARGVPGRTSQVRSTARACRIVTMPASCAECTADAHSPAATNTSTTPVIRKKRARSSRMPPR